MDLWAQILVAIIGGITTVAATLLGKDAIDGVLQQRRQERKREKLLKDAKRIIIGQIQKTQPKVDELKSSGKFDREIDGPIILNKVLDNSICCFTKQMVEALNETYEDPKIWMAGFVEDMLLEFKGKKI